MTAKETARELHQDTRGAVMMTGLVMSCFLIGGLWFLIGIGDAIVFRDRMQEAADHAAFTSAALHAKGMNFISACNLILLAMFAIHIIMGIIHDILLAICIVSLGFGCGAWLKWRKVWTTYHRIMKPVARSIHGLELLAAYGYPYLGAYKGWRVGRDYGEAAPHKQDLNVMPISTSLVPGNLLVAGVNRAFRRTTTNPDGTTTTSTPFESDTSTQKKGLPVRAKKNSDVCKKIASMGLDALVGISGRRPSGRVFRVFKGIVGGLIAARYCNGMGPGDATDAAVRAAVGEGNASVDIENATRSESNRNLPANVEPQELLENVKIDVGGGIDPGFDSFWGKDGPLVPWAGGRNGSPWYQIWSMNLMPEHVDVSEHRVGLAARQFGVRTEPTTFAYFAASEFYFDCTYDWGNPECNADDNAGYAIKWRARLRRLQFPQVGALLSSFGTEFLLNLKAYKDFKKLAGTRAGEKLGKLGGSVIQSVVDGIMSQVEAEIRKRVSMPLGDGLDGLINAQFGGIYH